MNKDNDSGGIGFAGALTIAFIVLKLCKVINWSWLWVLSPMWVSLIVAVIFTAIRIELVRKEHDNEQK